MRRLQIACLAGAAFCAVGLTQVDHAEAKPAERTMSGSAMIACADEIIARSDAQSIGGDNADVVPLPNRGSVLLRCAKVGYAEAAYDFGVGPQPDGCETTVVRGVQEDQVVVPAYAFLSAYAPMGRGEALVTICPA